jgi:hypothetical protein
VRAFKHESLSLECRVKEGRRPSLTVTFCCTTQQLLRRKQKRHLPGVWQYDLLAGPCRRGRLRLLHGHQIADIGQHGLQIGHLGVRSTAVPSPESAVKKRYQIVTVQNNGPTVAPTLPYRKATPAGHAETAVSPAIRDGPQFWEGSHHGIARTEAVYSRQY